MVTKSIHDDMPELYKVLDKHGKPYHGGRGRAYEPGKKRRAVRGIHVCTIEQLPHWIGPAIYPVVRASEERIELPDKTVLRWVVLGEPFATWNEHTMRLFACDCAERLLHIFEQHCPGDSRPREAIAVARRYANGDATARKTALASAASWRAFKSVYPGPLTTLALDAAAAAAWVAVTETLPWTAVSLSRTNTAEREWQAERLRQYLYGAAS